MNLPALLRFLTWKEIRCLTVAGYFFLCNIPSERVGRSQGIPDGHKRVSRAQITNTPYNSDRASCGTGCGYVPLLLASKD